MYTLQNKHIVNLYHSLLEEVDDAQFYVIGFQNIKQLLYIRSCVPQSIFHYVVKRKFKKYPNGGGFVEEAILDKLPADTVVPSGTLVYGVPREQEKGDGGVMIHWVNKYGGHREDGPATYYVGPHADKQSKSTTHYIINGKNLDHIPGYVITYVSVIHDNKKRESLTYNHVQGKKGLEDAFDFLYTRFGINFLSKISILDIMKSLGKVPPVNITYKKNKPTINIYSMVTASQEIAEQKADELSKLYQIKINGATKVTQVNV